MDASVNPLGRAAVVWDEKIGIDFPVTYNGVYAAVRPMESSGWSPATKLAGLGARNAGSVVDPVSGKVTVFWNLNGESYAAASSDGGMTWATQKIPVSPGFTMFNAISAQVGPFVDVDASGTITVILVKPSTAVSGAYDAQAITRSSSGKWGKPVNLTAAGPVGISGRPKLNVLSDRSAFLQLGFATFRRSSNGKWSRQQADSASVGAFDSLSADIDASGKGYFVVNSAAYGAMLSTSTPGSSWTPFQPVASLNALYDLRVTGTSGGHAVVTGIVRGTANAGVSSTGNGGQTWSASESFGFGRVLNAEGGENGLFAASWVTNNGTGNVHATLTGNGAGGWQYNTFGSFLTNWSDDYYGAIAVNAMPGTATARLVTAWQQPGSAAGTTEARGASGAVVP